MAWWQYLLAIACAVVIGTFFAIALPYGIRLFNLLLWKVIPDCWIKRQLFKVRGTAPEYIGNDPWVTQYHVKTPQKTNRLQPPPEFISAEEFKAKTPGDRR